MIHGAANSVRSACVDTRVTAALVKAGPIGRTVVVNNTFRICTFSSAIDNMAEAIRSTWRWITGFNFGVCWFAGGKRITNHIVHTRTNGAVVDGVALGTIPADSRAWIRAFIVDACLIS